MSPFQGWLNEMQEYDPEAFHPSMMTSMFATLDGSILRLESPRCSVSRKAQYDDEALHDVTFVKTRTFHLVNSKVGEGVGGGVCVCVLQKTRCPSFLKQRFPTFQFIHYRQKTLF